MGKNNMVERIDKIINLVEEMKQNNREYREEMKQMREESKEDMRVLTNGLKELNVKIEENNKRLDKLMKDSGVEYKPLTQEEVNEKIVKMEEYYNVKKVNQNG